MDGEKRAKGLALEFEIPVLGLLEHDANGHDFDCIPNSRYNYYQTKNMFLGLCRAGWAFLQ